LDEAIRLDPNDAGAYKGRGKAYSSGGDYTHVVADFEQALKLAPSLISTMQMLQPGVIQIRPASEAAQAK
jgi:Flp pilus assembly protein TadD